MLALALSTLFTACFGLGIRTAQGLGANLTAVGAVNYLTAMLVNLALAAATGSLRLRPVGLAIALAGGATYASAFFLVFRLTRSRGAAVTGAVMRLSSVVPVAVSLLAWGERLDTLQAAGAALALASLPLLSFRGAGSPNEPAAGTAAPRRAWLLVPGLFAINGLCLLVTRGWRETGITGQDPAFLAVLFAAAVLTAGSVWIAQKRAMRRLDILCGIAVGACNALGNRFIVIALQQLPGTVVYPFYSAVGLVITVVVSRLAWRERFGPLGAAGMAIACLSIVLVNLDFGRP